MQVVAAHLVPYVELTAQLAGLEAMYEDGNGADADAADTHVMLRAEPSDLLLNVFESNLECKVR